jgi:hypothetical protein
MVYRSARGRFGVVSGMGRLMGRLPNLVRLGSGLLLQIVPAVAATVIGGYLLAQMHFGSALTPAAPPDIAAVPPQQDATIGEERAAMREVLKQRREKPEQPAMVRPVAVAPPVSIPGAVPASAPAAAPASPAGIPVGMDSIMPNEPVARPAARTNVASIAPAAAPRRDAAARPRPDAQAEVYVPAPPPGLPSAPARDLDAPTVILPATASVAPPPPVAPEHRGPVGLVLSTVSNFVGHAANATGHTVNWVIDLPGKAISVGGRVIGITPTPPPARPFS